MTMVRVRFTPNGVPTAGRIQFQLRHDTDTRPLAAGRDILNGRAEWEPVPVEGVEIEVRPSEAGFHYVVRAEAIVDGKSQGQTNGTYLVPPNGPVNFGDLVRYDPKAGMAYEPDPNWYTHLAGVEVGFDAVQADVQEARTTTVASAAEARTARDTAISQNALTGNRLNDLREQLQRSLRLTGASGNYLSAPHQDALNITGDIDMRAEIALDNWTTGGTLLGKFSTTPTANRQYRMFIDGTGRLGFSYSPNGSTNNTEVSSVLPALNGEKLAVRVSLDVDNGAGGHVLRFYTAPSIEGPWQILIERTKTGTTSMFAGTAPLEVGSFNAGTGGMTAGKIYRALILTGINGPAVASVDLRTPFMGRYLDGQGNPWSLTGSDWAWSSSDAPISRWYG